MVTKPSTSTLVKLHGRALALDIVTSVSEACDWIPTLYVPLGTTLAVPNTNELAPSKLPVKVLDLGSRPVLVTVTSNVEVLEYTMLKFLN